jgi:leucine dehydrogenase
MHHDQPTGAWIFIAIHSTHIGPAAGGTRMKSYPSLQAAMQDAFRLAEGMTYKFAGAGATFGGGKAVIALPPDFDPHARKALLRRYGAVVHQLGGLFYTAADVGTSAADMDVIAETGAPYIFGRTPASGGAGSSGPATALGVFTGIQVVCNHLYGDASPKGRRVLVQGTGSVGATLIEYLRDAEASVVFSEVDETAIRRFRDELGLDFVAPDSIYAEDCDIFAPCALGAILNAVTIPQLRCKAIAGAANNQLADEQDAARLQARGILYAPDYVVNAGGALYIPAVESQGLTPKQAEQLVVDTVGRTLRRVLELAEKKGLTSDAAARQLAEERLAAWSPR